MQADSPKKTQGCNVRTVSVKFYNELSRQSTKKHEQYLVAITVISNIFFQFLCLKVILNSTTHWYKESSKYSLG